MMTIELTKGKIALVDDADYEYLISFGNWYAGKCYPQICDKGSKKTHLMHIVLWGKHGRLIPKGMTLDHRDGDGFNNQMDNLRIATRTQNVVNSKTRKHNRSGFKGVHLDKRRGTYQAMIRINNKLQHIGMFDSSEDAACAFNFCAKALYGEFARLNTVPCSAGIRDVVLRNRKLAEAMRDYPVIYAVETVNW